MSAQRPSSADQSPRRLLLVASNENFRKTLCRILSRCGYTVDAATSGEEALSRIASARYDAVITDVRLPGHVCGITLMHQVRAEGREVPIIFLTEEETSRIRAALEAWNGVECVQLPLDVDHLKRLVARRCSR